MNRSILWVLALIWIVTVSAESPAGLKSFDIREQLFSTQLMFKFTDLPHTTSFLQNENSQFEIHFAGISRNEVESLGVVEIISRLPFAKSVILSSTDDALPGARISITIDPKATSILVRKYPDLAQVVIEVFAKSRLRKFAEGTAASTSMAYLNEQQQGCDAPVHLV